MAYEPQHILEVHNLALAPNKQNTFGTAVSGASYTQRPRTDGTAFAMIDHDDYGDMDMANKGHQWPTFAVPTQFRTSFDMKIDVDSFLAGWLPFFCMGAETVTGAGPYTHTIKFLQSSNQAPVTSLYIEDTADIKYQFPDMAISELHLSGSEKGPIAAQIKMIGSGKYVDGSVALPAVATPTFLFGSDTDILIGPQAGAVSIKERVRGWDVTITAEMVPHYAPGGGLNASFMKVLKQRATFSIQVAAKDTDDMRTLDLNNTLREVQINTNSGASAQLNLKFPGVQVRAQLSAQGVEEIWTVQSAENKVFKSGSNEVFQATVINNIAAYGVGA